MNKYDVVIIGAGPAGSSAALSLKNSGLKVALCDKAVFPREKICGDGLCDRSINTLKAISERYYEELIQKLNPLRINKADLVYKKTTQTLSINSYGYTIPRLDFDNFLFSRIKRDCANVDIFENCHIKRIKRNGTDLNLFSENIAITAKLVIFADGPDSTLVRQITGISPKKENNGIAVRAYYKGIKELQADCIELHFRKDYMPGYFWIFPLKNGLANVGFGHHLKNASQFDESIKQIFYNWIDSELKERFANAEQISPLQGGLIPFSKNRYNCSGDNYLIAGDAASLVDPITGGGIGNAMFSGREAALQAVRCFERNDFSTKTTNNYNFALKKRMHKETLKRVILHKLISRFPGILDFLLLLSRSTKIKKALTDWYLK